MRKSCTRLRPTASVTVKSCFDIHGDNDMICLTVNFCFNSVETSQSLLAVQTCLVLISISVHKVRTSTLLSLCVRSCCVLLVVVATNSTVALELFANN